MLYAIPSTSYPAQAIESALDDLRTVIIKRLQAAGRQNSFTVDEAYSGLLQGPLYLEFKKILPQLKTPSEWIVLLLSVVPHLQPDFFSSIMAEHLPGGGDFPEFGGVKGTQHRGILPTGETARFIVAGNDAQQKLDMLSLFEESHFFYQRDVLYLEPVREGEPMLSGRIIIADDWLQLLLTGREEKPRFSQEFPAKRTTTRMNWDDLVLHPYTAEQIEEIKRWFRYHHILEADQNLARRINHGFRVLFYGPPGTGKTLTAALIGKEFGKDVYRIDLSQIVSKYIGETEKNLNKIFDRAQHRDWLLFFDEADALFGKRTSVQSSHDKYANQEVSFLLQRIEEFNGLMILASNFKSNIDEAFLRRFHSIIHFPMPNPQERLKLWKQSLPQSIACSTELQLQHLADNYPISGAAIINVMHYASLKALSREGQTLQQSDLLSGIKKELLKEEKSI